jgi:hypothetical protein
VRSRWFRALLFAGIWAAGEVFVQDRFGTGSIPDNAMRIIGTVVVWTLVLGRPGFLARTGKPRHRPNRASTGSGDDTITDDSDR